MVPLFILVGILIIVAFPLAYIWRKFISPYLKIARLRTNGTRVIATVTRLELYPHRTHPDQFYNLFAQWEQPQTGNIFTFQTPITDPNRFAIGDLVPVLINPKDPGWYLIEVKPDT